MTAAAWPASAGMTSYTLNEVARLRLEDIAFFSMLLLVCGAGVMVVWNYLARGMPFLPRLNFLRSICLTGVLSLLMLFGADDDFGSARVVDAWSLAPSGHGLSSQ